MEAVHWADVFAGRESELISATLNLTVYVISTFGST